MGIKVPFVDILIFAIIAIFLVLRLRNILGTRDGYEQSPEEMRARFTEDSTQPSAEIVPLRPEALSGSDIAAIKKADPSFNEDQFVQGAGAAFGMVLTAFADGDLSQLRRLLGYDLFNEFSEAIRQRNADNETLVITIQSLDEIAITSAELNDGIASVTVKFVSHQTRQFFNAMGEELVDDDDSHDGIMTDIWTFERDVQIADPNWKLVETSADTQDETA